MERRYIRKALLLCFAGLLSSCGENGSQAVEEQSLPTVTVGVAARRDVDQASTFTGTIEAQVSNNIAPQSPARIGRIYVEVGDRVKKGQKLVEMDGANLAQAKVRMENDKAEFERVEQAVDAIFNAALELGGTLSGEHGIGTAKAKWLEKETSRGSIMFSRRLRKALDPKGLLNPTKLVGV